MIRRPAYLKRVEEALAIAERLGDERWLARVLALRSLEMRPLVGQCHLGLARRARRMREREAYHQHLAIATATFRELGMSFWREQADAEAAAEW
ncbi:MAG TPA: hypothetical protein VMS64_31210 [Candidatus Methylomirabilis sp.]|nr:hypothetical protein [Candidatus Methylomirabilis sp.]